VRKDGRDVLVSRGYRQFVERFDAILQQLRASQQFRADLNPEAVRAALIGMTESLLRDQVVAGRSDFAAGFSFDDIRSVLRTMVPALAGETAASKSSKG
jgi:hypothetical protein